MKNHELIIQIYNDNVTWFSENRTQQLLEKKYLDQVIKLIPKNGSVLDIGCGIGRPIANYFLTQGCKITGVDSSQNMIKKAQKLQPNAHWIVADMRNLNLDLKFNAVIAWDSFFHLTQDNQRKMFEIFSSHLLANGVLLFTSGPEAGEALGEMNGCELYHSSLSPDEYKKILNEKRFKIIDHQVEDPSCGGHTVWIAQKMS